MKQIDLSLYYIKCARGLDTAGRQLGKIRLVIIRFGIRGLPLHVDYRLKQDNSKLGSTQQQKIC